VPRAEDKPGASEKAEERAAAGESAKSRAAGAHADSDSGDEVRAGARKHGKKGAHDYEDGRLLGRRDDSDRGASRDGDEDATFGGDLRGEVRDDDDATFSRPRRAWHHHRRWRHHSVDSIRGIFEGQP
jgi:hypothetical protein